ncbi:RING finger protein 112-like isoform X3 [Gopherus evgoodei]|uniref:RING finger protein 112-like isoform X3 n=1 Tax=Gopherus evgoodei TaxID=1825980 RepID=UPI0011CF2F98|nr:RING finger protein 112-like isoform X3 [Gopherus evgoodei]
MGLELEPGRPVQLVRLDEEGDLTLDREALSLCLEQGGVGDAPVCLVSIVGEQRWGKSFLLNYLLRRLQHPQDARDGSWMGRQDEPLEGFEWRRDEQQVTKGLWAWSQPFWVPAEGRQVAVLLVDTEGSMDLERNKETSIKLSAMSMLLSSYQILNIGRRVKDPDLEYLEMFLHVAEVVGEAYGLEPVQHLDLLVRDWSSSPDLGAQGGEQYLRKVKEMAIIFHNQGVMDRARRDHNDFLKKSVSDGRTFPSSEKLVVQRRQLLEWCRKEMLPKTESPLNAELMKDKEALLRELEAELMWMAESFKATNEKHKKMVLRVVYAAARAGVFAAADAARVVIAAHARVVAAADAGLVAAADAGLVAAAGAARVVIAARAGVVAAADAWFVAAAGAGVVAAAGAGVVAAAGAGVVAAAGAAGVVAAAHVRVVAGAGVIAAGGTGVAAAGAGLIIAADAGLIAAAGTGLVIAAGAGLVAAVGARLFAAARAGVVAPARAGVVAPARARVVAPARAGVVAPAGAGVITAAGARVVAALGAGVTAATRAGVVAAAGAGVSTAAHAGVTAATRARLIIAVSVGVVVAVWAIFIKCN